MSRTRYNSIETVFICTHCGRTVLPPESGTRQRNHCPFCLRSSHVDISTGDRRSLCRGSMEPIAVFVGKNGEWSIVHRCERCGWMRLNRIAGDDDALALLLLAMRPVSNLPFPMESFANAMTEVRHGN